MELMATRNKTRRQKIAQMCITAAFGFLFTAVLVAAHMLANS